MFINKYAFCFSIDNFHICVGIFTDSKRVYVNHSSSIMFSKQLKFITGYLSIGTGAAVTGIRLIGKDDTNDTKPHVVVVGGGIIGSWSTWLLCHLARYKKEKGKNR